MRVLVTGAAGFIGSALTRQLREAGHGVVAVDALRGDPATLALREERLRAIDGRELDLVTDPLEPVLDGVDAIAHLAAATGVRTSYGPGLSATIRDNVSATARLAEAAAGRRFVLASSSSVYGSIESGLASEDAPLRPISPYGASKVGAEAVLGAYAAGGATEAVILRYFTVYGPGQRPDMAVARFIAAARAGRPLPILGDGTQVRAYTYLHDVLRATEAALTRPGLGGAVCNIAGTETVSVSELAGVVGDVLGVSPRLTHEAPAPGDVRRTAANLGRAERLLGWHPQTRLADGVRAQAAAG